VPRRAAALDVSAIIAGIAGTAGVIDITGIEDEATDAVLDAAAELLDRYGVRRWSMEDVADVAGVGRATVYRRFPSREDLVHATIAREVNRFFAEVASAVADAKGVEAKVVDGFLVGMRMANTSLIPGLFENDKPTALSLFTSAPVLELGRVALVSQYQSVTGEAMEAPRRAEVEWVAEVLVRLAVTFVLMPGSVVDFEDPGKARQALARIVRPLLLPRENAPRPRSPRRPAPR
jgi:AcrR family transcriptional regulator